MELYLGLIDCMGTYCAASVHHLRNFRSLKSTGQLIMPNTLEKRDGITAGGGVEGILREWM